MIPPSIDESDPKHPGLPPVECTAWLTCYQPIDQAFMGSALVVVWFCDESENNALSEIIHTAVRSLPWESLAEDFDW
jgi:hypothetical protein